MNEDPTAPTPKSHAHKRLALSGLLALAGLAVITYIWYTVYNAPPQPYPGELIISSSQDLERFYQSGVTPADPGDPAIFIPTGVVIQSLEFKGPYTVQASGYVWQRYADSVPTDIDRGVVFPDSETTTMNKVYETHQDHETLIGWNFKTTLREQFDYSRYPLDRQLIWMRLWHIDFEHNVYLAPDVDGYESLKPSDFPGIDPNLVLENWEFLRSYFSLRMTDYTTNFGIRDYDSTVPQPELYFNLSIKRLLWSPLIARLLAPLVILIQLFVIVMVIGTDSKRLEQFGVRPGAVIFTCAAFFFAVLVAENSLRDEIKSYGLVYLESVHLVTYVVILLVAANSVLLVARPNSRLFQEDNALVEFLYWPVIIFALLIVTLWVFYWLPR